MEKWLDQNSGVLVKRGARGPTSIWTMFGNGQELVLDNSELEALANYLAAKVAGAVLPYELRRRTLAVGEALWSGGWEGHWEIDGKDISELELSGKHIRILEEK